MARRKKKRKTLASKADKYDLYQRAVQDPESDLDFLISAYQRTRKRKPRHLREDFCGTALLAASWADYDARLTAEGFDISPEPLAWGTERNLEPLGDAAARVTLHQKDVREPGIQPADIRCAQNFSYQVFHARSDILFYFRQAHAGLSDSGIFVLDIYGGWHALQEREEERELDDFVYVWDQKWYAPVSGLQECAIHFRFDDESEMRNAFVYDWRYWSMAELHDLLREAGFARVDAYFEQFDDDGDGNGVFEKEQKGHNCESWIAYLVAVK